jgi:hypothetical protein
LDDDLFGLRCWDNDCGDWLDDDRCRCRSGSVNDGGCGDDGVCFLSRADEEEACTILTRAVDVTSYHLDLPVRSPGETALLFHAHTFGVFIIAGVSPVCFLTHFVWL